MSYEDIGRIYGITGAAIKKAAKKFGLQLKPRRTVTESEDFSHGGSTYPLVNCMNCGTAFRYSPKKHTRFCSHRCQHEYQYIQYISRWQQNLESGFSDSSFSLSKHIRRYLFEKYDNRCQLCDWGETNPFTKRVPLQIHHIDGNFRNNTEDNLQLLCPNCHSLTENYGSRNKNGDHQRTLYFGKSPNRN